MRNLRNIVPATLKTLGLAKKFYAQSVLLYWRDIVGDEIAAHSSPVRVIRGMLFVNVTNSVWSHHLFLLKHELIGKINTYIGEEVINDIRFQAGKSENYQNQQEKEPEEEVFSPAKLRTVRLTKEEVENYKTMVASVADPNLQKRILSLLYKDGATKKLKMKAQWQPCRICGTLRPPQEDYCTVCKVEQKEKNQNEVRLLLSEAPWLTYAQVKEALACSPYLYRTAKIELLQRWGNAVRNSYADSNQEAALAMLLTGFGPDKLTDEIIRRECDKFRRKGHVFTPRS